MAAVGLFWSLPAAAGRWATLPALKGEAPAPASERAGLPWAAAALFWSRRARLPGWHRPAAAGQRAALPTLKGELRPLLASGRVCLGPLRACSGPGVPNSVMLTGITAQLPPVRGPRCPP